MLEAKALSGPANAATELTGHPNPTCLRFEYTSLFRRSLGSRLDFTLVH